MYTTLFINTVARILLVQYGDMYVLQIYTRGYEVKVDIDKCHDVVGCGDS